MNETARGRIAFDVETSRILEILSSEIYDSPKAFLRENVQNAYDATLMRCTAQNLSIADRRIEITVEKNRLVVKDDGIGMTEEVLKHNFWKAGSSGKKSELAQRSGVIGTVRYRGHGEFRCLNCTSHRNPAYRFRRDAHQLRQAWEDLRIAQDCIDLDRVSDERGPEER